MKIRTTAALVLASGSLATAQSITTHIVDDGAERARKELTVRASPTTRDVMVAWMQFPDYPSNDIANIHYNVSTSGYLFRCDPGIVPRATSGYSDTGGDPTIAFGYDGKGWLIYGNIEAQGGATFLASKDPGAGYLDGAIARPFSLTPSQWEAVDKQVVVVGAPPGDQTATPVVGMLCAYRLYTNSCWPWDDYGVHSVQPTLTGNFNPVLGAPNPSPPCPQTVTYGERGGPNDGIILRNVPSNLVGRWVAVYYRKIGDPCFLPSCTQPSHDLQPAAAYSDDGESWTGSENPEMATVPVVPCNNCTQTYEAIEWFGCSGANLVPQGGPSVLNAPCLAADPRDERIVYMVFLGRTNSANQGENIDLFIARSNDSGVNFSYTDANPNPVHGQRVLHLRDEDLGDPEGAVQFLPSIAVDTWGGVHVLYYVGWRVTVEEAVQWRYQVKMVSLEQFRVFPHPTNNPNVLSTLNVHRRTRRTTSPSMIPS